MLARRLRPLRNAGWLLAFGAAAGAGCSSGAATTTSVTHPTMIRVEPEDFQGPVVCARDGSGFKVYVATIVDRDLGEGGAPGSTDTNEGGSPEEGGADGFRAPSSDPTPCTTGIGFGFVVPNRHYEVFIDGYDRDDLVARAPGSAELVPRDPEDPVQASVVAPRWRSKCTDAVAADSTIVRAGHCAPFQLDEAASTGSVRIAVGSLLGDLRCGTNAGQVTELQVVASASDGTETRKTVACRRGAEVTFDALPSGAKLAFYVGALGNGDSSPFAGAECHALVKAAASVDADCAGLSQIGTLRVDLASALAALGGSCRADLISDVTLSLPDEDTARHFPPPDCSQPFDRGFPPGPATLTLSASFLEEPTIRTLTCDADVEPGRLVTATCTEN